MLSESDKFFIAKNPDADVDGVVRALGRKKTPKLVKAIEAARAESAAASESAAARDEVVHKAPDGKRKFAAMTAAGSMRADEDLKAARSAAEVPSRRLKDAIHKID